MAATQPKKPAGGAYGRFLAEKRGEIKASLPQGHKITDVTKKAGELFKALSAEERQKYEELYKTAQAEYDEAMQKFKADGGVVVRKSKGKRGAKNGSDVNAPKKPAGGAYGRFLAAKRGEIRASLPEGHKITDVTKKAGELFKALSAEERQRYEELYKTAQAEYAEAMQKFKADGGVVVRKARGGKGAKKERDADAPRKPVGGACGRFLAEKSEEIRASLPEGHKITDVSRKAGELFKALSDAERERYESLYKEAQAKYEAEMKEYRAKGGESAAAVASTPTKGRKRGRPAATPTKDPAAAGPKRGREAAETAKQAEAVALSQAVLEEAKGLGYESQLQNLASRPDVVASGKKGADLLAALVSSKGLVNPARRAVLAGAGA